MPDSQTFGIKTAKNAVWNVSFFIFSIFFGFITAPILVRKLGLEGYGLYGLIMSILAPLNLTNLGFGEATVKYVAQYYKEKNFAKVQEYISTTFFMSILVGVIGFILIFLFGSKVAVAIFLIPTKNLDIIHHLFHIVAFGWLLQNIVGIFLAVLPALQNYKYLTIGNTILLVFSSSVAITVVLLGGGLIGYTAATVLGSFVAMFYWYFTAKKLLPQVNFIPRLYKEVWKNSFRFGSWQTTAQVGGILANQSDKYLLGSYLSTAAVGIYNIAFSIEQTVYLIIWRLGEVLFPAFSYISDETPEHHFRLLMRASWLLTILAVSLLIPLIPISYDLLSLWINPAVAIKGSIVLQLMAIGGAMGCSNNATYFYLLGMGRTKVLAAASMISGIISFTVAFLTLPVYGLKVAGLAGVVVQLIMNGILVPLFFKKIFRQGMSYKILFASMYAPTIIGVLVSLGLHFSGIIVSPTWFHVILFYIIIVLLTFFLILITNHFMPYHQEREDDIKILYKKFVLVIKPLFNKLKF